MNPELIHTAKQFAFAEKPEAIESCKYGHINDTYAVYCLGAKGTPPRYILQRINHHVFRRPDALMENIARVTTFLRDKISGRGGDPDRETLNLISTKTGQLYHTTPDGDYWRAYAYIPRAQTYQIVRGQDHVYQAARAFGRFQHLLADFPLMRLHDTIPDFHHTPKRLSAFRQVVAADPQNRAPTAAAEIEFVETRAGEVSRLIDLLEQGDLPLRVTHNDTKVDNVLIDDESGEGICVIDLDTVMPGLSLYDFGDFVRSGTNPAAEDERDLAKVKMHLAYFEAIVRGYLGETRDALTALEKDLLTFSAWLITFEIGMRFLTDYLNGDRYFRIHRPEHNLDRCRTQFKLVADMEGKFDQMQRIVERYR
ncbi:MAG TPA: aminoglycoside phosphotransferase family protein [Caldilineae bacterium]|nr:aminoglycoside phosphotransferase family protein [Caldilineae bacterium]